jgi:2-polyprenyl-3-methyl-5-hydroxy-6-metoxy-1,4-benzoquinol methylase
VTIRSDPENNEINALFNLVDLTGKHVLEIGCGDGRLTWRYADAPARVTAIDAFENAIRRAKENVPKQLRDRVEFRNISAADYAAESESAAFDIAILSWSL